MTKRLSKERFDLFAIGTRRSPTYLVADELSYWSDLDENVIGVVFRDRIDNDFGWALMVRDRLGRFRGVRLDTCMRSERLAEVGLRIEIGNVSRTADLAQLGIQGDETNAAVDLLAVLPGTRPDQLHPYFKELIERPGRAPARAVLREIGPWLTAADPHFVREFQRYQFDQRLWELYLWAAFREGGYDVEHGEAPDFRVSAPGVAFTVEATTVAPSKEGVLAQHPNPQTPEEVATFLADYMPMKYGNSLTKKLNRRSAAGKAYWEEEHAIGLPFVIAVADFHKPASEGELGSMTYTQSAIWPYLYGFTTDWEMVDGRLVITRRDLASHTFRGKTIESGFFSLPAAENISAILFSNAGTLAKFDRIGVCAGYGPPDHRYMRVGMRYDPDPNAFQGKRFVEEVGASGYLEGWADELQVFHNPNASRPLPREAFGPLTQHFFDNGEIVTYSATEGVISSFTMILQVKDRGAAEHIVEEIRRNDLDRITTTGGPMSIFDILTPEFLGELPLEDASAAFPIIARRALEPVSDAMRDTDLNERSGWAIVDEAKHTAMNSIIAAAKRLDIEPFSKMQVPRRKEFDSDDYADFRVELDHYLMQTLLDNGIRERRDSIAVPSKVKDRLRTYLHAMRTQIDGADMPESRRASLLKKLADFETALERDRLPIFAVARIVIEVLSITANVLQLTDSPTFAKLTTTIIQEVAKAKAEDDATRQLPPAEPPRIALPPRAPEVPRRRSPMMARSDDLDDDIPF